MAKIQNGVHIHTVKRTWSV